MDLRLPRIAAHETLFAEAPEICGTVRLSLREPETGQMIVTEFKIVMAQFRDFRRIVCCLRKMRKKAAHLRFAFEIELLSFEAHAVFFIQRLPGLDAHQYILIIGICLIQIMGIIGQCKGDAGFTAELLKSFGYGHFFGNSVVLDLQIKTVRTEQLLQFHRPSAGMVEISVQNCLWDFSGETAGQADQTLCVLMQKGPVDAGFPVETIGEAGTHQRAEISVTDFIPAKQDQMRIVIVDAVFLPESAPGSDIDFATDNWADTFLHTGAVKGHRAVHDAVVCDGNRTLP